MLKTSRRREARGAPIQSRTRRTTWTLPRDVLRDVERFASDRHQTVSSAAAYLLQQALRQQPGGETPGTDVLEMLRKSFAGLTEAERMLVDGIILEDPSADSK
jgi:CopG-like RHH_1 or ribbon-helix-helix domain, RHH_5